MSVTGQVDVRTPTRCEVFLVVQVASDSPTRVASVPSMNIPTGINMLFTAWKLTEEDETCNCHVTQILDTNFLSILVNWKRRSNLNRIIFHQIIWTIQLVDKTQNNVVEVFDSNALVMITRM